MALAGRDSPFLSTSESRQTADHFSGAGRIWTTTAERAAKRSVRHIGRTELLHLLSRRSGAWSSQTQRVQAYAYVKRHAEHLLDFSPHADKDAIELREIVDNLFDRD